MPNKHIRVYELAKELNKTSKEIMAVLAEKNIEVTTIRQNWCAEQ